MKHRITQIICALVILVAGAVVICDGAIDWFGATRGVQYACNAVFFFLILPSCVCIADVAGRKVNGGETSCR